MLWAEILYLIFIYVLLAVLVKNAGFFRLPGISPYVMLGLLAFKFIMAIINFYYIAEVQKMGDALSVTKYSYKVCCRIFDDPEYFKNEFIKDWGTIPQDPNFLNRNTTFWQMLGVNLHRRLLILLTFISFGQPYITSVLFSFISFIGQTLLYKSFVHFFPNQKKLMLLAIFCFPLAAFWISGISKESYMALAIGLILYTTVKLKSSENSPWKYYLLLILSFLFLFWVRNFYLLSIFPFYIFWLIFYKQNSAKTPLIYIVSMILGIFLFFQSSKLPDDSLFNLYENVSKRQAEFIRISEGGGSTLKLQQLLKEPESFTSTTAESLNHVFLRPYPKEIKNTGQLLDMLSSWLFLAIVIASILLSKRKAYYSSFFWFILSLSLSNLLMIGITVPNIGAISRYKTIFILLIVAAFIGIYTLSDKKVSDNFYE